MNIKDIHFILSIGISACLGAVFGILRSKIFSVKVRTTLYFAFYILSFLLFAFACYTVAVFWPDSKVITIISFVASIGLAVTTFVFLVFKDTYTSEELNPIVIKWTSRADKNEIKLFGGDLDFFGKTPSDIAQHPQYINLCAMEFKKVCILCEEPSDSTEMIRYGKILNDIKNVELRFYKPERADLKVRGRIIQVNASFKLLIYLRVEKGIFRTIQTDTADSTGALYNNIWELTWSMADSPTAQQISSYTQIFLQKKV